MLFQFLFSSVAAGTTVFDTVQETNISDQQVYTHAKVVYTVNGVIVPLKTAGISIKEDPGCYTTTITGKSNKGFANGTLDISFWEDTAFTIPSPASTYDFISTKNLTYVTPAGTDTAAAVQFTVTAGVMSFKIRIRQDPFIAVTKDTTAGNKLVLTSENLNDKAAEDYTYNEVDPAETLSTEFVKSPTTFYTQLLFNCEKAKFRACIDAAVIDCSKNIEKIIKCIQEIIFFDCLRKEIAKICPILPPAPICPPKPCPPVPICPPAPCPPTPIYPPEPAPCPPTPIYPPGPAPCPPAPVCPPVYGTMKMQFCIFLNVCVKASAILTKCVENPQYLMAFNQGINAPYAAFMSKCDTICGTGGSYAYMPNYSTSSYGMPTTMKYCPKTNMTKPACTPTKPKKKMDTDESTEEEEDEDKKYSTGVYIAGGVGIVVVVSVCTYVGWQFLS